MDSKHRHELQANELEQATLKVGARAGELFDRYGNHLAIAICVIAILSSIYIYTSRTALQKSGNAWNSLSGAGAATDFADVADRYQGTPAANWAYLKEADLRLREGVQFMFTNRESANVELKKAKEAYEAALLKAGSSREIRERALYGIARTLEAQSTGDTSEALAAYERLTKEYPDTFYLKDVEAATMRLKQGSAQDFYAWFAKQNPKPADPRKPADRVHDDSKTGPSLSLPGATGPALDSPTGPALELPKLSAPTLPGSSDKADKTATKSGKAPAIPDEGAPASKDAAKPEKSAAEETPAEKPAEKKEAAEEKPATEKNETEKNDTDKKDAEKKEPEAEKKEAESKESAEKKEPAPAPAEKKEGE